MAAALAALASLGCNDSKPPPIALPEAPMFPPEGALPQLTPLALLVPDTEVVRLLQAGGERTGQLRLSGGNRGALWVQTKAALQGATHIALTQSQLSTLRQRAPSEPARHRCQPSGSDPEATLVAQRSCEAEQSGGQLRRVSLQSFQMVTVPVDHWDQLPEGLRPTPVPGRPEQSVTPAQSAATAE